MTGFLDVFQPLHLGAFAVYLLNLDERQTARLVFVFKLSPMPRGAVQLFLYYCSESSIIVERRN